MYEHVITIVGLDKTKALFDLEPFHFAGRHADLTEFAPESVPHCADGAKGSRQIVLWRPLLGPLSTLGG